MIPLLVSPDGLRVLVVGGGPVALRKCMHFEGADITVIAEKTMEGIEDVAKDVIKKRATVREICEMMDDFDITIMATDNETMNSEIRDCALSQGLYVNSAHGGGNILIPSVLDRERYLVTVSTNGKLPAFPPFVVEELETFLDGRFDAMYDILFEARIMCAGKGTQKKRSEFLKRVAHDPEVRRYAADGDVLSATERVKELGVPK